VFLQPRQHAEAREHFERFGRAWRGVELALAQELLVDLGFVGHAQTIRHGDDADAIEESFVVLVGLEQLPLGLVRMRENHAIEGDRPQRLSTDIISFLRRR
jgi:hypothetical protein